MELQLRQGRSSDEGNGVGKSKQTPVRQMEDHSFNCFPILNNGFLSGGVGWGAGGGVIYK